MEKTRLGISVGLLGAVIYLIALFGGTVGLILIAGYTLLFEGNVWLRKSAVVALFIVFGFAILSALIGLIPDAIGLVTNVFSIFDEKFDIPVVSKVISLVNGVLDVIQKLILMVLALTAFTKVGGESNGFLDKLVGKHMG